MNRIRMTPKYVATQRTLQPISFIISPHKYQNLTFRTRKSLEHYEFFISPNFDTT